MIVQDELGQRLDEYLSRITPFGFAGAALLSQDGKIVLNKGYGLANRAQNVPNSAQTVFSLGSVTKQFTAAAIMKLEMQGKLNSSDPIHKFFPGVPTDKAAITLHHLLTHTAGLLNYTGEDYEMADKEETVLKILESELLFPPGGDYDYSNAGYTLLAAIVEQVAQRPYEQFLQEELFTPAGMLHTGYRLPNWSEMNVAHWYNGRNEFGTPLEKAYPSWNLLGNGDMLSTTEDMFRWHIALQGDGILSAKAKQKMYTPEQREYGYGWRILETENGRCIQHNGASSYGSSALFRRWVDAGVTLMLFCNTDYHGDVLIMTLQDPLEALIFGDEVPSPPKLPASPPVSLAALAGDYQLPDGGLVQAAVQNDALQLTSANQAGLNWLLGLDAVETAIYNQTFSQTEEIMTAALAGDTEPLLASLNDRGRRTPGVLRTWETLGQAIQPTEMTVLGVRPSLYLPDAYEAMTQFSGSAESLCFVTIWRDGQNVGVLLTELANKTIFTAVAQPLTPDSLASYHLAYAQTHPFQILREDDTLGDKITGLISEQNILAQRQ
ncbi:serine hydrolase domain-containing protein [Candidatus Leptofilum sp.]|uniref:serine hydrolase domain-containing protein n=1 Tax=Candidatus Leptofilum sp. TaxID=3241576 RepID=UPI003B5B9C11